MEYQVEYLKYRIATFFCQRLWKCHNKQYLKTHLKYNNYEFWLGLWNCHNKQYLKTHLRYNSLNFGNVCEIATINII